MAKNKRQKSYEKGATFEQRFAEYLKSDMGYDKYKIRNQIKQATNSRGANIDIIGERLDARGRKLQMLGNIYLVLCAMVFVTGLLLVGFTSEQLGGALLTVIAAIIEIIAAVAISKGKELAFENVWVECKNLKGKADITMVRKMISEVQDYRKCSDKKYKFVDFVFVSVNGFVDNALELAVINRIDCYVVEGNKFKKISNWK